VLLESFLVLPRRADCGEQAQVDWASFGSILSACSNKARAASFFSFVKLDGLTSPSYSPHSRDSLTGMVQPPGIA
jgi:hypothetical protein